jgi:plastocyanin
MKHKHLMLLGCAAAFGCGGDDGPSQPSDGGSTATVSVINNQFNPSSVSIPVNGTVTWQWNSGGVAHNVTFQDGNSGDRTSGSYARPFSAAGNYSYVCTIHAAQGMTGTVTVTGTAGGGGGTGGGGSGGGGGGAYP